MIEAGLRIVRDDERKRTGTAHPVLDPDQLADPDRSRTANGKVIWAGLEPQAWDPQLSVTGARRRSRDGREVHMLSRRRFGSAAAAMAALSGVGAMGWFSRNTQAVEEQAPFEVTYSDAEWRERLTPEQYYVLRAHGTERAGTSPLDREKRAGTFVCAGCDLPLFSSESKYDSGTGWPSFFAPLDNAIGTSEDRSLFMTRTEVHCRRCGGHLGHVFEDGPPPTGLRYCMNGVAMKFVPAGEQSSGNA